MAPISRRVFLRAVALAGLASPGAAQVFAQEGTPTPVPPPPPPVTHWDGSPLGRILLNVMTEYQEPSWRAKITGNLYRWNAIVPIVTAVGGEGLYASNHTWLQTATGYIYSSWVQPVNDVPTNPTVPIGEGGAWGMVTVPITDVRNAPRDDAPRRQSLYYSNVNRIVAVENDYYKMKEIYGYEYWIKAGHVRIITPEEVAPISPDVPPEAKRIEVRIGEQVLRAFEGDVEVFASRISSGVQEHPTPHGTFRVKNKRHGQRMTGGVGGSAYNLAGIPWICYFNSTWVATHGTYWHNDYGRRHSNGCVNLHPEAAKWVFRWTTPVANYWDYHTAADPAAGQPGTQIVVKW